MTAPVTGPFDRSVYTDPFRSLTRVGYRQATPFNLPLPYDYADHWGRNRVTYHYASGYESDTGFVPGPTFNSLNDSDLNLASLSVHAYNRAYEKLKGKIGDTAGWSENLAQFKQASSMACERLAQMVRFVNCLRKFKFVEAAHVLRMEHKPHGVSRRKRWQDNFLEYEYGWRPLVNDISSSIRILTETDFGTKRLQGRSRESASWTDTSVDYGYVSWNGTRQRKRQKDGFVVASATATVRITNPNLYLAGAMGIIDPALPWKLVPYSFIVDWFANVEQVLSSLTGFLGVTLEHPFHSFYYFGTSTKADYSAYQDGQWAEEWNYYEGTSVNFSRRLGIPSPTLTIRPFKGFSVERGLQAIALLTASLGARKR